jgi:hypothetical protein
VSDWCALLTGSGQKELGEGAVLVSDIDDATAQECNLLRGRGNVGRANVAGIGLLTTGKDWYGEASKEHDFPLVQRRRRGRGTVLCQDLSRFIGWRIAPRTGRFSIREERGCADGRIQ